jgi:hypothetical protein
MPINTDLNTAPYFDDFDIANQYYRILFKPGFAVQARELTQLQTILQSQIEQFGDNIFKEGSIVKGCNFTTLGDLQFVKLSNPVGFDPLLYSPRRVTEIVNGIEGEYDYVYEVVGESSGLRANIISASRGFQSRPPNLNTFFINYLNTSGNIKQFQAGENLTINLYKFKVGTNEPSATEIGIADISVTLTDSPAVGRSYGIQSAPGIIFQKGHFLFTTEQTLIVSKYSNLPDSVSVGYRVQERLLSALNDSSLYDNANGSNNENAPGADRLNLIPILTVLETSIADTDPSFFALIRYQNGSEVALRDVSQYNVLAEELAKRTFEESGNYILNDFSIKTNRRVGEVNALVGTGVAYVKGFRIENTGERSFVIDQLDQVNDTEIQVNQPVSFNYGSYVDVISYNGFPNIETPAVLDLLNNTDTKIGETFISNITPNRVYLYGTRLNSGSNFNDVFKIDSPNGEIVIANTTTSATLKDTKKTPLIFDTGVFSVKETTDMILPVRDQITVTANGSAFTISAAVGEDFAVNNSDLVVIETTGTYIPVTSATTSNNNSQLNIVLSQSVSTVQVYFNKRIANTEPYDKTVKEPFIKTTFESNKTKYSLGFPDVFELISVVDNNGEDFTDSFRLKTNQKDQYYDLSYIEYIQGRAQPANAAELTIHFRVFELNTAAGDYFFTVNSYPNTLDTNNIPIYESAKGMRFNLRECFDFRPHVNKDPLADYNATTPAAAPTISAGVESTAPAFSDNGVGLIPALNSSATTDIEYYLSRIDLITVDSYGEIKLVKGNASRLPVPPKVGSDKLTIAEIKIPGFPALSQQEASNQRKREYAIVAKSIGTKNYTMKDIKSIERKVDDLVYYVSLSQLETETQNLSILDENGLNRFKNGFVVDPFNDLSLSDINDVKFNAAIPFNRKILTPSVKTFPIDLKYKESNGVSIFPPTADPKVATLGRSSDVVILSQPYASEFRNCVSNFYKYAGEGTVSPPYDATYDTTINPLSLDVDLITPFEDFIDNIQEFLPLTDTTSSIDERFNNRFAQRQETLTNRQLTFTEQSGTGQNTVGEFVTNFQFNPYMSSRDIKVYMSGLRPDTQHHFFFDGVNVDSHVIPGTLVNDADSIERNGLFGTAVLSDSNGVLRAVFRIPDATFFVGDRVLKIADVDQYDSIDSGSTSQGFVTYRSYNFSVEKAALTIATRAPDFDLATTTTTRNLPGRPRGGRDPLAQTFFIKEGMGKGSNSVFLSKVDLYFKRKSNINGVTLMIREVTNGYPTSQIVPFSKVHFTPSQVNVSDDASVVTTFTFEAPIRLDVEKEYAIVVMPDANDPNYLIYTSKVGGVDLTPGSTQGQSIVQDWGDGVLFTSTNNKAWKSYQDEDIKFVLYIHEFNESLGRCTLVPRDSEFLSINDISGRFNVGELVYQEKSVGASVGMTVGSNILTGTSLTSNYNSGDYILITGDNNFKDIFKVIGITNDSQMTVNKPIFTALTNGIGTPIIVGTVAYYNRRNPNEIHLDKSSVRPGRLFQTAADITGFDSGSTANVNTIDNISISYVQPMIIKANDSVSTTDLSGTFVSPVDLDSTYQLPMKFNDNNYFNNSGAILYSKSNDITGSKAFEINIDLTNSSNSTSTGFIDIEVSKLLAYQYRITNNPNTTSSYISKPIELSEDFDAEDLNLIITAYKPEGTEIRTYIRPQNVFDSDSFQSIDWIELELFEGVGVFSSTTNINDYREFKYKVANTNKDGNGVITYTSNAGDFSGYRKFAIRIDMISNNNYSVPSLKDYRGIALT